LDVIERLDLITQAIEPDTIDSSPLLLTEILLLHQFEEFIKLTLQPSLNLP
jgi:hypothetical protein